MLRYSPEALPFVARALPSGGHLAVSESGDHVVLDDVELGALRTNPRALPLHRQAKLKSLFFLRSAQPASGLEVLLQSRREAKRATAGLGPSLHILVPTLQCAHTCQYCQVSRSLDADGVAMSIEDLDRACDTILESAAPALTVEFQGGDPLLRFDLVRHAILRIAERNRNERRAIRFVVASTLHQLTREMCEFFRIQGTVLSTSIDGPAVLHNRNRPTPERDAYEKTVEGIALARRLIGPHSVSALMTTTKASLEHGEDIVDAYVDLGLEDIFLRPLSLYGFAKRNRSLDYSVPEFMRFYDAAIRRILHWNHEGRTLREFYASIILNKLLCPFDLGYVDLQSPAGAGQAVLVYNYDGFVYPSDEARMLAETGDTSLRLARIGASLRELRTSPIAADLVRAGSAESNDTCRACAYNKFCAPNPVDAQAQFGAMFVDPAVTHHCVRHQALFDYWVDRLQDASPDELDLYHDWAQPSPRQTCAA